MEEYSKIMNVFVVVITLKKILMKNSARWFINVMAHVQLAMA